MDSKEASTDRKDVVLLTGSSGCLGHQTLKLLLSHDDQTSQIRCLDLVEPREEMRREVETELRNYNKDLPENEWKQVKYFVGDVRDVNLVESIMADFGVTCVIHCAAKIDIWTDINEQNREELESINIGGTEILLKSCIRFGVPKFVHVSSFEIFTSLHTVYYATESTIPEPRDLLFGQSGKSKKRAEAKVRQYANNKLRPFKEPPRKLDSSNDFLNAVIVRYTPIYGEYDRYFVSKYLKIARFFSGKLQRFSNIWIRQQPIYVGNAAWALICAKNKMNTDESISGEDFHVTDDTPIGDPFDFVEPFLEAQGMRLSKSSIPGLPVWLLMSLFFWLRRTLACLDIFNLFTKRRGRLEEALERDRKVASGGHPESDCSSAGHDMVPKRWWHIITPQTFFFGCNSLFLNRTKASLRLNYEPIFTKEEALEKATSWYRDHSRI